jgi:hypothetical protein
LGVDDYNKFLEDLAKNKKVDLEEIKSKMASCGAPGFTGVSVGTVRITAYILMTVFKIFSERGKLIEIGRWLSSGL